MEIQALVRTSIAPLVCYCVDLTTHPGRAVTKTLVRYPVLD